ncbi:maltose ABC transporter substrate-binding protein, partial [Clostridium perfringens]|nr:maltose ABC transporter substrate-binding protein [Clostridium perfringens]
MFKKKFIALVMATLVAGSALTGCGSSGKTSKGETLTIWSKVTDKEREVIQTHANNWGKENGYEVQVLNDDGGAQDFLQVANSSKAPDMYIGVGHDNLSTYQVAGVVDEVPSSFDRTGYVNESVWNATAIGGKNYAVPFAQETV